MPRQKCRDCSRCTESTMKGCLIAPLRFFADMVRVFFIWPFTKMCPVCRHPLAWHKRDAAGRFAD